MKIQREAVQTEHGWTWFLRAAAPGFPLQGLTFETKALAQKALDTVWHGTVFCAGAKTWKVPQ